MNFDAIGNVVEVGDWVACIRNCRTSFSVFPARIIEINEKSFKVFCGRKNQYDWRTKEIKEVDDIQTLYKIGNTIKIFVDTLPEDVYLKWKAKLEPQVP